MKPITLASFLVLVALFAGCGGDDGGGPQAEDCALVGDEDGSGLADCDDPVCYGTEACPTACGNGKHEPSEGCDDGNRVDGDGCDGNCTVTACGNGVKTMNEGCDDGNDVDGDGCDRNCATTGCGNGVVTGDEGCDDGNATSGDGCDANCTVTACGNDVQTMDEACDDGNLTSGDGCDANCTATACGNGVATASTGEACDDGNAVEGDGCDSNCSVSACGNGVVAGGEACDDGNTAAGDGCSAACQKELLAVFTFTGAAGSEASLPADGAAPAPGLASIPVMSRGAGLTPSAAADAFSASAFTTAAALDAEDYYTFTVAPDAGFTVSLAQIILDERRSATGIRTWNVRSSLDGFAADLATVAVPDDVLVRTSKIPLGPAFANLSAPVELRIYGFAAEGSTGTWRLDNVELLGVTAGP